MRYWVFSGAVFYPVGGAHDVRSSHDEYWEARYESDRLLVEADDDWAHVFDVVLGTVVYEAGPYNFNGGTQKARGCG